MLSGGVFWNPGFTRTASSLWSMTMLCLYVRVQVNILGRHLYLEIAHGSESSQSPVYLFILIKGLISCNVFIRIHLVHCGICPSSHCKLSILFRLLFGDLLDRCTFTQCSSQARYWKYLICVDIR